MLFPYTTDAPIYHWPIATVGLIAVNTVVFVLTFNQIPEQWILQWGVGLHPAQWITSNFLHIGILHLLGNMICLWGFGLVVEGKIGWWRFLLVYLLIGAAESCVQQILMLGADGGGSLGASGAIFGIMAMALVWAPKNEMTCVVIVYFRPFEFDCPILGLAGFFLLLQVVLWGITMAVHQGDVAYAMTSEALHLMGAAAGFGVAVFMLKKNWVDCENWDLFSVAAGRHAMSDDELLALKQESAEWQEKAQKRRASALDQIRDITRTGQPALAYKAHRKMVHSLENWQLPDQDFLNLILAFHRRELWKESIEPMVEYLNDSRPHERQVRLKLAHILIEFEKRPGQALRVLRKLDPDQLTENQRKLAANLMYRAQQLAEQDPYEVVDDDW